MADTDSTSTPNPRWRVDISRRRKVRIGMDEVLQMLALPAGTKILAVEADIDPVGFTLVLAHDDWSEVPPDAMAPYLHRLLEWVPDERAVSGHVLKVTWGSE